MTITLEPAHDPDLTIGPGGGLWRRVGEFLIPLDEVRRPQHYATDLDDQVVEMPPLENHREESLADYLAADPEFLGERLLVIGRHVEYGDPELDTIDFVAISSDGRLHLINADPQKAGSQSVARSAAQGGHLLHLVRNGGGIKWVLRQLNIDDQIDDRFATMFGKQLPDIVGEGRWTTPTLVAGDIDGVVEMIVQRGAEAGSRWLIVTTQEYQDGDDIRLLVRRNIPGREEDVYLVRPSE